LSHDYVAHITEIAIQISYFLGKFAAHYMPLDRAYSILEASSEESDDELARKYKKLVMKNHPDLAPADQKQEAHDKMVNINLAYESIKHHRAEGVEPYIPAGPRNHAGRRSYQPQQGNTFDDAAQAANVPFSANWMFVTTPITHWKTRATAVLGRDDNNIYIVGIYNRVEESPTDSWEIWKMDTETVPLNSSNIKNEIKSAIKEALNTVIRGDHFLEPKGRLSFRKTSKDDFRRGIVDGTGSAISINGVFHIMGVAKKQQKGKTSVEIHLRSEGYNASRMRNEIIINNTDVFPLSQEAANLIINARRLMFAMGFDYFYGEGSKKITALRPTSKVVKILSAFIKVIERTDNNPQLIAHLQKAIAERS